LQKVDLSDVKPVIFSCEGLALSDAEKNFFAHEKPLGFILFGRNVETPKQVSKLAADFRQAVGRPDAPVLVDQEGGRVQRLKEPHWYKAPSFGTLGAIYNLDPDKGRRAVSLATRLIALDLTAVGISVNCSPCLDLSLAETSSVIGNRSFSEKPEIVAELATIVCDEYIKAGIAPVIKHLPGHGRGAVDSHIELPTVDASMEELLTSDFVPFKQLSHMSWGMTAHIVFEAIDPDYPATQSNIVIEDIIRGEIGFDGVLLTDDLNMNALSGTLGHRAKLAQEAGIDILLHCSGKLDEMREVAAACSPITDEIIRRIETGPSAIAPVSTEAEIDQMKEELAELLALV